MAEIRCPMCGKPNPAELDVCQFCQARLKPLIISQPPEEPEQAPVTPPFEEIPSPKKPSEPKPSMPDWTQPDWLQSLREGGTTQGLTESEAGEEELPDWTEGEPAGESPAWMEKDFSSAGEGKPPEVEPTPPLEETSTTDWLDSLRQRSHVERERTNTEKLPDWMSADETPEEETPEWLQKIRSRQKSEEPQSPPAVPDDEASQFLQEIRGKSATEEKTPTQPLPPKPVEPPPEVQPAADIEVPEWLADMAEAPDTGELPELPEWLQPEESLPEEPAEAVPPEPAQELPPSPFIESKPEEAPAWLSQLEMTAGVAGVIGEGEGAPPPEAVQEEEEAAKGVAPFTLDEESSEFIGEEMPDWLKGVSPQDIATGEGEAEQAAEDLTPAQLPTWLESMRPVEAVAPSAPVVDERERVIESSGPLAGLRGILPAEPEIARLKKPPTYSVKLQVSEAQGAHVDLLAELVKSEGIAKPLPRPSVISSQMIQRVVIFLLLFLSILFPLLVGEIGVPLPEPPAEVKDAQAAVNALPASSRVLLAVDYQPGFAGEMSAASASIVDHLMIKGAYLTLVSTTTTGPVQAERLVRSINTQMGHHYQDINQYANLGYIAGGLTGLRSFAQSPQGVMPYALNGKDATEDAVWANGRLAGMTFLSDFNLVLVITENPDTARAWIEQVKPVLGKVPLLLVVSAQAEPMLRPYYESTPKGVDALITGLSGGAAYESTLRPGIARPYWEALSFGAPVAVFILLIGALAGIILAYLPIRRQTMGEGKS